MTVRLSEKTCAVLLILVLCGAAVDAQPKLPSGPPGKGRFGAYATRLRYGSDWDDPWRIGPRADVVVRFDRFGYRLVFWHGANCVPYWMNGSGRFYSDGSVVRGDASPRWDSTCRYSHARVIESSDARAVVHWRYALVSPDGKLINTDPMVNWNDWVDEFYTVYPDGVAVRRIKLYTSFPDQPVSCQQSMVLNGRGSGPQENVRPDAVTLLNLRGQARSYSWGKSASRAFAEPSDATIQVVNLAGAKSAKPFQVVAGGMQTALCPEARAANGFARVGTWPVSGASDRPSHTPLTSLSWKPYARERQSVSWMMMTGLTQDTAAGLAALARSWIAPAKLTLVSGGFESGGYDAGERAYRLACKTPGKPSVLRLKLAGSSQSPVRNPAFVIGGWGVKAAAVRVDGAARTARCGYRRTPTTRDLVVWVPIQSAKTVTVEIRPQ